MTASQRLPGALGEWTAAPYVLFPRGDWTHVLLSSPLARYRVLDEEHVRIWGKGRHNYTGLLCRHRLAVEDSSCAVRLHTFEVGAALVLYGGTLGRETALELRRTSDAVSVHATGPDGRERLLTRGSYGPGETTLRIDRRGDTFECRVNDDVIWRGTLPFHLPPARPFLRALGDSGPAEGRERSAVFGPVMLRGVQAESTVREIVVGPDGRPVASAWIHIAGDPFAHAQTDDGGRFSLTYAPKGGEILIAGAEGLDFTQVDVLGDRTETSGDAGAGAAGRDAGADVAGILLKLPAPSIPRPEYPRPDFDRSLWWVNLNGLWRFALDPEDRGRAESWQLRDEPFRYVTRVPFPWTSLLASGEESLASDHRYAGVWAGYTGTAWYKRKVTVPGGAPEGETGVLKFLAVNALAEVYWDGRLVGTHEGGFSHFECEVGKLEPGSVHDLAVRVEYPGEIDPVDTVVGKQGWWFTHAPGIWQTAWLESRSPAGHITRFHVRGDVKFRRELPFGNEPESAAFHVSILACGGGRSVEIIARDPAGCVVYAGEHPLVGQGQEPAPCSEVARESMPEGDGDRTPEQVGGAAPGSDPERAGERVRGASREESRRSLSVIIPVERPLLWDIEAPNLYTFEARLKDGEREVDRVGTYSGLREVRCDWAPGHGPAGDPSVHGAASEPGARGSAAGPDAHAPAGDPGVHDRYKYVYLNDLPVYLIGILDQGYNPWGVYTYRAFGPAGLPGSIQSDIEIARRLGYNINRMHIKANEPLWLYEAARRGLMVWDEIPNFRGTPESAGWRRWVEQYEAQHERDFNCPAIVIRSLFNEGWGVQDMRTNPATQSKLRETVARQRRLEPHRLVVDNSAAQGYPNRHVDTDINDEHIYFSDWWAWRRRLGEAVARVFPGSTYNFHNKAHGPEEAGDARQDGQPYVISEFSSEGRMASAMRMFPKIAGFVKIDLVDQEWERFTPLTYTRALRPLPFIDADFNPLGEEMEHSLDAVAIDAPPVNFYAPGTALSAPLVVASFHRSLRDVPITLHVRWSLVTGDGRDAPVLLKEQRIPVSVPPFSVKRLGPFEVEAPATRGTIYLFAWLERDGVVTARGYCEWKGGW